jgi:hypothetical protein
MLDKVLLCDRSSYVPLTGPRLDSLEAFAAGQLLCVDKILL